MITFGFLSSVFDFLTFGALLVLFHATEDQFRTGWFIESVVSACLIVLVIRSRRPFFSSRPSNYLLIATLLVVFATVALPCTPLGVIFGLSPLPLSFILLIITVVFFYILSAEIVKVFFYKKMKL